MILFADPIDTVVVHHSASIRGVTTEDIRKWHTEKGWDDIGYHGVIETSGRLVPGRDLRFMGAHAYGHNAHTLGICVTGNNTEAGESWLGCQIDTLRIHTKWLKAINPRLEIVGHRDLGDTLCPGVDIAEVL